MSSRYNSIESLFFHHKARMRKFALHENIQNSSVDNNKYNYCMNNHMYINTYINIRYSSNRTSFTKRMKFHSCNTTIRRKNSVAEY